VAGFDPDAYLAQKTAAAGARQFDPDAYLTSKASAPAPSTGEAVGRGGLQGATMGFGDELGGALQAGLSKLRDVLPDSANEALGFGKRYENDTTSALDVYRQGRDEDRAANKAASAAHPWAYGTASVAGSLPTMALPGGAALQGAVAGLGNSDADLTKGEVGGAARDAAIGALLGKYGGKVAGGVVRAGGKALGAVGGAIRDVAPGLAEFAELSAAKVANPMLKGYRLLQEQGIRAMGREMLDSGAVKFGDTAENVAQRVTPLREAAGKAVGESVAALDKAGAAVPTNALAGYLRQQVLAPLQRFPAQAPEAAAVEAQIAAMEQKYAGKVISLKEAEAFKRSLDNLAHNFSMATPPANVAAMENLRGAAGTLNEVAADAASPKLADAFRAAKERFGNLAPAEQFAKDFALRKLTNRGVSLSDYQALVGGMAQEGGDAGKGMLAAAVNKLLRERGRSSMAVTADALAKFAERHDSIGAAGRLLAAGGQALGKYAAPLAGALAKSPALFEVLHNHLWQSDPEYRQAVGSQ
jgi:hypothetical protein